MRAPLRRGAGRSPSLRPEPVRACGDPTRIANVPDQPDRPTPVRGGGKVARARAAAAATAAVAPPRGTARALGVRAGRAGTPRGRGRDRRPEAREDRAARPGRAPRSVRVRASCCLPPETTPPGTYEGRRQGRRGGDPVVAEVEPPSPRLAVQPADDRLQARRARRAVHVSVLNDGNVALEIAGAYAFGLFADEGVERRSRRRSARTEDEGRAAVRPLRRGCWREQHGGFVRVRVAGAPACSSPASALARAVFRFPDGARAGRGYAGALARPRREPARPRDRRAASAPRGRESHDESEEEGG